MLALPCSPRGKKAGSGPLWRAPGMACLVVTVATPGIVSASTTTPFSSLEYYPNPAMDEIHLSGLSNRLALHLSLYNTNGEKVRNIPDFGLPGVLPLAGLPAGLYWIILSDGEKNWSKKLIIAR